MNKRTMIQILAIVLVLANNSAHSQNFASATKVRDIDGNEYRTVKIGNQVWFAENLKTTKLNDGTPISNSDKDEIWRNSKLPVWQYYENNPKFNNLYGKLYNSYAVTSDKLCPIGWRVPSKSDWQYLQSFLGGQMAGKKLKASGTIQSRNGLWQDFNDLSMFSEIRGTDDFGFSALPGGYRISISGSENVGFFGYWWSVSQKRSYDGRDYKELGNIALGYNNPELRFGYATLIGQGYSCRCIQEIAIKDNSRSQPSATSNAGEMSNTDISNSQRNQTPAGDEIFRYVEKLAEFPGGKMAWANYISTEIEKAIDDFTDSDYGTCIIKFVVDTDGRIFDVHATNMQGTKLAQVSINAIKNGPKWIPAQQDGRNVKAYRLQPITLKDPNL